MKANKHTSGPWAYEAYDFGQSKIMAGSKYIAQLVGDSAEAEANGVLIAGAPGLLEAAINFLKSSNHNAVGFSYEKYKKAQQALELAIEKASK